MIGQQPLMCLRTIWTLPYGTHPLRTLLTRVYFPPIFHPISEDPSMYRTTLAVYFSALFAAPLFAQTTVTPSTTPQGTPVSPSVQYQDGVKSPGIATLISVVIPGGGQMYADKVGKGLALLGITYGSLIGGAVLSTTSCSVYNGCSVDLTPLYIGGVISLGTWIYSMATAGGDARDHNASLGLRATRLVEPVVEIARDGRTNIGLRVALSH